MTVLVPVETSADGLVAASAEALTFARGPAAQLEEPVEAVLTGDANVEDAGAVGVALASFGVARCYRVTHPQLARYSPEYWGEALAQLITYLRPSAVIAPATDRGAEIIAQAAARADLPLAANCIAVTPGPAGSPNGAGEAAITWQVTRVRNGGMVLEDAELTAPVKLLTVVPGTVEATPVPGPGSSAVETFTPEFGDGLAHSRLVDHTTRGTGVTLASARVVVSGGRGVGSAEGFAPLERLAELTGGAVGCSRVVTNNGWRPHSDQVGQTGTKVNPELYIACGISGATQHWVGCMGAKAILAINTDPEAPLVTRATYAVIGDVGEVVSAVVAEIEQRQRSHLVSDGNNMQAPARRHAPVN